MSKKMELGSIILGNYKNKYKQYIFRLLQDTFFFVLFCVMQIAYYASKR